jgi:hypothetical protein
MAKASDTDSARELAREAGLEYTKARMRLEAATAKRDNAIRIASKADLSRREVTRLTSVTVGRVQQIDDSPATVVDELHEDRRQQTRRAAAAEGALTRA